MTNRIQAIGLPTQRDIVEKLSALLRLGDLARLTDDPCADLLTGLTLSKLFQDPAVFGRTVPRPTIPASATCGTWPPKTAPYTEDGKLIDPTAVLNFPLVQVGYALSTPEVRAALLGLLDAGPLACDGLQQLRETLRDLALGRLQSIEKQIKSLESKTSVVSTSTTTTINRALPTAYIRGSGQPGDVIRRIVSGPDNGWIEVATGPDLTDQENVIGLLGANWTDGQLAEFYPNGTIAPPIAVLTGGRLYRNRDGRAVPEGDATLIPGDATIRVAVASAAGLDVLIDSNDLTVPSAP